MRLRRVLAVLTLAGAAMVAVPAAATGAPRTFHVDCFSGDDAGSGRAPSSAWRTLAKANSVRFGPGDRVLFHRGTRCAGTFEPTGSGTAGRPISAGAYGRGAKPGIDAGGALAAVLLRNVQGWEIRDLDLTDSGPPPGYRELRFGVYVVLTDFGIGRHYVVENVSVHDVNGCECQVPSDPTESGGIFFKADGDRTPTGFDDITVRHNTLRHVDRGGIGTSSSWERRPAYPQGLGSTWVPFTRMRISGNLLTDIGGDGIGVYNAQGAVVEDNVLRDYANRTISKFSVGATAYNSDRTLFRRNEISGGIGTEALPAQAFIIDGAAFDTVFEGNLTRGNRGGALIICVNEHTTSDRNVYRYNISQDDDSLGSYGPGAAPGVITAICAQPGRVEIYGNTIYSRVAQRLVANYTADRLSLRNNIFVGRDGGSSLDDRLSHYDHNLYASVTNPPPGEVGARYGDPKLLAPGTATSTGTAWGYLLRPGSPALRAGTPIPGGRDYFGFPVPHRAPSIGASAAPGR